eukprot:8675386-Alexandrium_andersonii.AAC.1
MGPPLSPGGGRKLANKHGAIGLCLPGMVGRVGGLRSERWAAAGCHSDRSREGVVGASVPLPRRRGRHA